MKKDRVTVTGDDGNTYRKEQKDEERNTEEIPPGDREEGFESDSQYNWE